MKCIRLRLLVVSAFTLLVAACSQSPVPQNGSETPLPPQFGTKGGDVATEIAVDNRLGAVFVAGATPGAPLSTTEGDFYLRRYARDGSLEWGVQSGNPGYNTVIGLELGDRNQVYVAGYNTKIFPRTSLNSFLKQYTADGDLAWSRRVAVDTQAGGDTQVQSVTTDPKGDIFVVGGAGDGAQDFISKYASDGRLIWNKLYPPEGFGAAETDRNGNLYVVGYSSGSGNIRKYTASGQLVWEKEIDSRSDISLSDLQIVGSSLYVAGQKYWDINDTYESDAYIAKFDLAGNRKWAKSFGTRTADYAEAVAADSRGNVYVTGYIGVLPENRSLGNDAIFVHKYHPSGSVAWTRQFGSPELDSGFAVAALNPNEIYAGGYTGGDLGAGYFGEDDAFLTRFNSEGKQVWVR